MRTTEHNRYESTDEKNPRQAEDFFIFDSVD
jgi:hypothetical protein